MAIKSLALGLVLILFSISPAPCQADRFAMYNIRVLDRITETAAADLDGDGLKDLVVLHTKGRSPGIERWISIFWHKPEGGFSSAADLTWKLPDEVAAVDMADVSRWTKRWIERAAEPVEDRLSDLPRSGAPDRITPEQWCQIMALACELPEAHDRPITHWSHKDSVWT